MIDVKLGASGFWLGTRTGAGGTATLTKSFFGCNPWLHGQQSLSVNTARYEKRKTATIMEEPSD